TAAIDGPVALDLRRVNPGSIRQLAHNRSEGVAARNVAPVQIRSPEHRRTAMDEETRRRIAVSDDPVGPDAEHSVGRLLIGRDPADTKLTVTNPPTALPICSVTSACWESGRE